MKCPLCNSAIITFGNEWECIKCGNFGSFLDDRDDEEAQKQKEELSDDEKIDITAARVLEEYRAAFEELAK